MIRGSPTSGSVVTSALLLAGVLAIAARACWAPCFRFPLLPVEASLNRSKGARGIADGGLPPSLAHQCGYVMIRATVAVLNGLAVPEAERAAVAAERC